MDFAYKNFFKMARGTGYETLIYDCMIGDATLFQRADKVEAGWQAVQPILDFWAATPADAIFRIMRPAAADRLRPTRCWRAMAAPGGRSTEATRRNPWQSNARSRWCWRTSTARSSPRKRF